MIKNNDEYGFLIPENHQIHENAIQAMSFRDRVKEALYYSVIPSEVPDGEAIAKIKELSEQSQLLGEITDILNRANTECLDHYRSKQEEKIVLTGFRGLCDIHAALFKKRSEYEIYGSRIINDLLNSVDLQAQKQAYDQEEIKRIDKAERESFDSLRELYFAIAEMLGVNNDKEMIAKIKELAEIKRLQTNQNRFDSANYDPFQDKYKLENIEHAISFRDIVASYLGCSYDRNEAIAKIEQLTGDKDREIERLNGDISGIASFLNLPSDAKQPDICFAIMELKQEKKKYYKGYFQLEVISKYLKLPENCKPMDITTEVIELKEELDQAKKIIARLVGK
jgi:hypothetical protein